MPPSRPHRPPGPLRFRPLNQDTLRPASARHVPRRLTQVDLVLSCPFSPPESIRGTSSPHVHGSRRMWTESRCPVQAEQMPPVCSEHTVPSGKGNASRPSKFSRACASRTRGASHKVLGEEESDQPSSPALQMGSPQRPFPRPRAGASRSQGRPTNPAVLRAPHPPTALVPALHLGLALPDRRPFGRRRCNSLPDIKHIFGKRTMVSVECLFLGVSSLASCISRLPSSRVSLRDNLELSLSVIWRPGASPPEAGAWGAAWLSQPRTPGLLGVS